MILEADPRIDLRTSALSFLSIIKSVPGPKVLPFFSPCRDLATSEVVVYKRFVAISVFYFSVTFFRYPLGPLTHLKNRNCFSHAEEWFLQLTPKSVFPFTVLRE